MLANPSATMEVTSTTPPCFSMALPTEMIREIIFFLGRSSTIPLSRTCRRLMNILELKLYHRLVYKVGDGPCLRSLRELVFTELAQQVRNLDLCGLTTSASKSINSVVAACVPRLPNLNTVRIPSQLFDNLLLNNIIQSPARRPIVSSTLHQSTSRLSFEGSLRPRSLAAGPPQFNLWLDSFWIGSPSDIEWTNTALAFFHRSGLRPSFVLKILVALDPATDLLLRDDSDTPSSLRLSVSPRNRTSLFPWIRNLYVSPLSPRLSSISIQVKVQLIGEVVDFQLDDSTWLPRPLLPWMASSSPVDDLLDEWWMVSLQESSILLNSSLLAQHLRFLENITIHDYMGIGWSDWPSTVLAFSSLPHLEYLNLSCSFTPLCTLFNAITCSNCIATFPIAYPQLHRDVQLVGGRDALWDATFELNVARLNLLGAQLSPDSCVEWTVNRYDSGANTLISVVQYSAMVIANEEDSSQMLVKEEGLGGGRVQGPKEVKDFPCWNCSGVEQDPVAKLMMCSVEEVRAALGKGGFDLEKFDASPLSIDAGPDSLEVFLRDWISFGRYRQLGVSFLRSMDWTGPVLGG